MGCENNACAVAEMMAGNGLEVRDPRNHSRESVETLRGLLAGGAGARPDVKRPHFYEIEDDSCVFYVYVSPVDGSVELLAIWPRTGGGETQARCH